MQFDFSSRLLEATRLVRAGSLAAATASIQRALVGATRDATRGATPGATPGARRRPEPAPGDAPAPDRMLSGTHAGEAGSRAYRTYVPRGRETRGMPLVVMLHGCKQNPEDFAAGTRMNQLAEASGFVVVYPAQCAQANVSACWNWFQQAHQQRERGEPALIAGITREVIARHALDARRVHVAGLSAGGAMAAVMGATYPELYASVGIHSGLGYASARDLPSALAAMRGKPGRARRGRGADAAGVPTIVFHGDSDRTVHPSNGERVIAGTLEKVERGSANGRAYTRTTHWNASGEAVLEHWLVHGAGHAWSGGSASGSFTDPLGPDASREMLRFFMQP